MDPVATMWANPPADDSLWRTLEADDIAGVQAIYGVRDPAKPSVSDYQLQAGNQVTLFGTGFAAMANEVWFTPRRREPGRRPGGRGRACSPRTAAPRSP